MVIETVEHKTNIRFRIMCGCESYIIAIDTDYDSENIIFTGHAHKLITPQFKVVKRSAYAKGIKYMKNILEYRRQKCYKPTSGMCFIKCIFFTDKDSTEEFRSFIRNEKY